MKKKTAFLTLGLVASLAGIATASALIINGANTSTEGALDKGLVLEWGQTDLDNVTNLRFGSPQIKELVVRAPVKSASVEGYALVGFELKGENVSPIQVEIFDEDAWGTASEQTSSEGAAAANAAIPDYVLDQGTRTCQYKIDLKQFTADMTFTIRYSLTEELDSETGPSATLLATYDYEQAATTDGGQSVNQGN